MKGKNRSNICTIVEIVTWKWFWAIVFLAVFWLAMLLPMRSVYAAENTVSEQGAYVAEGDLPVQPIRVKALSAVQPGGFHTMAQSTLTPVAGTPVVITGSSVMRAGTVETLIASCANYNGDFTFLSSDTNVATVMANGMVTAVAPGEVTITVQTQAVPNSTVICKGEFKLKVINAYQQFLTAISLSLTGTSMAPGVRQALKVTTTPYNAYIDSGFKYETSNGGIVSVNDQGVITAVAQGTATITVTSKDAPTVKSQITVTVAPSSNVSVTGITFFAEQTMVLNTKQDIAALVSPLNASSPNVQFSSSSESILKVSASGTVEAVGLGTALITARAQDGSNVSASISITVTGKIITAIKVDDKLSMQVGDSTSLSPVVEPSNATNQTLNYTSNNPNVVSVTNKGYVSAVAVGTAVITITATDEGRKSAQVTITVTEKIVPVTSIGLNLPGGNEMAVDEIRTVTAVVFPFDASVKGVEWFSSNEQVLSVSDGIITANEAGTAVVIASATDGTGITGRLTVQVYAPSGKPTTIALEGNTKMVVGETQVLSVILSPEHTIMPDLNWTSSDENVLNVSDGEVSADDIGTATITAKKGKNLLASIKITVVSDEGEVSNGADGIEFNNIDDVVKLKEGESFTVSTNVSVESPTQMISWRTSDSVVAAVNQKGKITGRRKGTAVITVSTMDGEYEEEIQVVVSKKEYKIKFKNVNKNNKLKLKMGNSKKVTYSVKADGAKAASLSWSTTKKSVAKITEKGKLTGVAKGQAKITLRIKLDNGKVIQKSFWAVVKKK